MMSNESFAGISGLGSLNLINSLQEAKLEEIPDRQHNTNYPPRPSCKPGRTKSHSVHSNRVTDCVKTSRQLSGGENLYWGPLNQLYRLKRSSRASREDIEILYRVSPLKEISRRSK